MKLLVERGQVYRCKAGTNYRYIVVLGVEVDTSAEMEGQVWATCREITAAGDKPPSSFPDTSPLRGFRRGEHFTSYLTVRDGAWQMVKGWERETWAVWEEPATDAPLATQASETLPERVIMEMPAKKKRGRPPGSKNKKSLPVPSVPTLAPTAATALAGACEAHPAYRAIRRPRSGCEKCLEIYDKLHSVASVDLSD